MTRSRFHHLLCTSLAALGLLALASCGGGSNDTGGAAPQPGASTTTLAAAQELVNTFAATLSGAQELPPTTSAAQGSGTIVVNPGTRVATATVRTNGLNGISASIQQGLPGVTGPIIFPLAETAPGSGAWSTSFILSEAQLNSLQAGNFYFNIGSAAFPTGEIRGQILSQQALATGAASAGNTAKTNGATNSGGLNAATAAAPNAFIAALRGSQETPPNTSTAQGSGAVVSNAANRSLLVAVSTTGITGTAAHIHSGAPGVAGPVIVPLAETPAGSGIWIASATLTDDQYNALTSGGLYLNVHSAAFPEGEIRGQILPVQQSVATQTGTGPFGAGLPAATTGTVTTGTGVTGIGFTDIGLTGAGFTGIGTTSTGTTGTGTTGTGTTSTGITSTGITSTGITSTGITSTGLTGTGLTGTGITGTTGTGTTGIGTIGTGLMTFGP